jgi:hypothetical protein
MSIVLVIVMVAATFGYMIFMKKRINTKFAHMRAGELAPRLGMRLTEGNPEHNLATMSVEPSVQNQVPGRGFLKQIAVTQVGGSLGEFKLHMAGQPYGLEAELMLYCKQSYKPGLTKNTTTTWHDLRLTVRTRATVIPFDLRLRKETSGIETRRSDDEPRMPVQSFGAAALDQRYVIESPDPSVPRQIAAALAPLAPYLFYVHIVGAGNQVSFVMTPASVMCTAPNLEQILHVLASVAAIVEGRPVPGAMAAAPVVMARA